MKNMFGLFRRHHGNGKEIWGALDQPRRSILSNEGGKLKVEFEEMPPLPKRSRISGAYCFDKRDQDYRNKDQCNFAIGQDQKISTKTEVFWDCAPTTEGFSTGMLIVLLLCTGWRIWSLTLIGLLNVRQPSKDWIMHYALALFCLILNHRKCSSWTQTRATSE